MRSVSRSYSRSRSVSPRKTSRDYDRRSPPRYERSRLEYRNGDRGDRYRDNGRSRYDDRGPRRGRYNDGRENPRPSNCLGIFGMSMKTKESDLRDIFGRYGRIDSVKIILDHSTGRSRGFGFINFDHGSDAARALEKIADTVIDGMKVRVDFAVQRRRTPPPRYRSPVHSVGSRRTPPPRYRSPVHSVGSRRTPPSRYRSPVHSVGSRRSRSPVRYSRSP